MSEQDDILERLNRLERAVHAKTVRPANTQWFVLPRPKRKYLPDPPEDGVEAGPGIDVTANKASVDLATDPGLEFDAAGDAGKLRVKPDAGGWIQRSADGVGLVDGTANNDILYWDHVAGTWKRLAANAADNYVLATVGGVLQWVELKAFACP